MILARRPRQSGLCAKHHQPKMQRDRWRKSNRPRSKHHDSTHHRLHGRLLRKLGADFRKEKVHPQEHRRQERKENPSQEKVRTNLAIRQTPGFRLPHLAAGLAGAAWEMSWFVPLGTRAER